ncbi:uncharacterized protein LOC134204891 [Armigeres subalbatus]|uniref:uncharacterized protein LOC134204891 n=1 Tax=Armigeres subalbatus TaxID=124917 RepID=UPI002ECFD625
MILGWISVWNISPTASSIEYCRNKLFAVARSGLPWISCLVLPTTHHCHSNVFKHGSFCCHRGQRSCTRSPINGLEMAHASSHAYVFEIIIKLEGIRIIASVGMVRQG